MKKFIPIAKSQCLCIFYFLVGILGTNSVFAQTHFESGDGWGTAGWNAYTAMTQVPGTSGKYVIALKNTHTGNKYFRMANGAGTNRYGPSGTSDIGLTVGVAHNLQDWSSSNGKAYFINVANVDHTYVFKSNGATSKQVVISEVQTTAGNTISSVSGVSQIPLSGSVCPVNPVTITATLNQSFFSGQGAYLRYTTNSFSTTTVVPMTGSGTTYTATIPGQTASTNVIYYVFTSGTGAGNTPALDGSNADWYTFNLNNNAGNNYSYTVQNVPTPSLSVTDNCNGTSTLTVTGATGSLTFSGGTVSAFPYTVTTAGPFTVTQTVSGCPSLASNSVTAAPKTTPSTPSPSNNGPVCAGTTLSLSSNVSADSYVWTGTNSFNSSVQNPTVSTTATDAMGGAYSLKVTVNGCQSAAGTTVATVISLLDYANLQFPATSSICAGSTLTAFGQVYEPGVTTNSGQGAGITAEFGYGTVDNPVLNAGSWTWTPALYHGDRNNANPGTNNDEYTRTAAFATPGIYYYTFRFRMNPGCDWQYGGYSASNGGFWNGTTNVSGVLTVNTVPPQPVIINGSAAVCPGTTPTYSVDPVNTATTYTWTLPVGWTGSSTTASINATPGSAGGTISVTANNSCGSGPAQTLLVAVNAAHGINLPANNNQTICANSPIVDIVYTLSGGATGATVTNLPAGLSSNLSGSTLTISGTASATGTYTVTTTGNSCIAATRTGTISFTSTLDYVNLQFPATSSICVGSSLTAFGQVYEPGVTPGAGQSPASSSGIVAQIGYSSANSNPAGAGWTWVNASFNTGQTVNTANNDEFAGILSGLGAGIYYYAFRYSYGGCTYQYGGLNGTWGATNDNGVLTVNTPHTINLNSANNTQTVCQDAPIVDITYAIGDGATGAGVSGLPNGVNGNYSSGVFTISGNSSVSGTFDYTVTTAGPVGCPSVTATGRIIVKSLLDFLNLQSPPSGTICAGGSFDAYGQVFEPGVTEAGGAGIGIDAEIGYGPSGSNPNTWTTWVPASFNTQIGNNDEYKGTFTIAVAGTYHYTFRYRLNNCGWQYAGFRTNNNQSNGYWNGTTNVSGVVTVNANTSNTSTVTACNTYTWSGPLGNGTTYTTSGVFTNVTTNAAGCPHTETLNLTINYSTAGTTTAVACNSYTWSGPLGNGTTYTTSGVFTNVTTNAAGCPHTETLNLTINYSTAGTTTAVACDTYTWSAPLGNGTTYTVSGTYTNVSTNAAGCSHTETLVLTINNSTASSQSVTACDTYTWPVNGTTYTTGGTYTYTSLNAAGCTDVKTLVLTINNSTASSQSVTACDTYTWPVNGLTYTTSGTYTATSQNAAGCTHTETLVLTIGSSQNNISLSAPSPVIIGGTVTITVQGGAVVNPVWVYSVPAGVNVITTSTSIAITSPVTNVYDVALTYQNACGVTVTTSLTYAVFYDPNGGFVTGGGWINSPAGALKAQPTLTGKANLGFVSKYKKGTTIPDGETEFQFQTGNLKFKSSAYDDMRLVIAGAKANYKGVGQINGAGNYGFLVSAIDGQAAGGGGVDKFRIKIWDNNNGNGVVYDNNLVNVDENDDPATALGGGSIVIHSVKAKAATQLTTYAGVEGLRAKVYPTISESYFTLMIESDSQEAIKTRVTDVHGRTIETLRTGQGQAIRFGNAYNGGVYFVEVQQGAQRKVIKLIKQ